MSNKSTQIIYVEDDLNLSMVVTDFLIMQGYVVHHFENAEEAIRQMDNLQADIYLLDIMLPGMDGFELAKLIQKRQNNRPILFLSAKNQIQDKIKGLEIGADDYITKPFSTIELDLRIKAILKRVNSSESNSSLFYIKLGKIIYDESKMQIICEEGKTSLTKKENHLLKKLLQNKDQIVNREELLTEIWGEASHLNSRSMDVYMSKIRKIIANEDRVSIINYHGIGFKLDTSKLMNN